jgi:hypothetical protein
LKNARHPIGGNVSRVEWVKYCGRSCSCATEGTLKNVGMLKGRFVGGNGKIEEKVESRYKREK